MHIYFINTIGVKSGFHFLAHPVDECSQTCASICNVFALLLLRCSTKIDSVITVGADNDDVDFDSPAT